MLDTIPRDIRRFESLQIITTIVGLVHQLALHPAALFNGVVSSVLVLALTFLVSRGRKKWPLWILVGFYLLGILVIAYLFWSVGLAFSLSSWLIVAGLTVAQAVALALAFTRQSSIWLVRRPAHA